MNPSPQPDPARVAKNLLTEAGRSRDRSVRLAWTLTAIEGVLLLAFALALIDYWLILPVAWRTAGAVLLLSLAVLGVVRLARYCRHPTRLKEAALVVESERPELGCEVSTAAEYLTGERRITHEYEPELVTALEAKAARHLGATLPDRGRGVRRPAVLVAATLFVLLIAFLLTPGAPTAVRRTALPFSRAHYTRVDVKPGDVEVPVGSGVEITNVFSGRIPRDPQLHWRPAGDPGWQTAALTRSAAGDYCHAFSNLQADVIYRVTGNDAASGTFTITTYVPPEVKQFEARLSYPTYTKRSPVTQTSPDITAVRASTAEIRIQPSVALAKAKLRFASLPDQILSAGADGSWTTRLTLTKDSDYWIELADAKGHRGVNDKPYHLKVLPDRPPKVEIGDPGQDIRASTTNTVPIHISAADDFGVGDLKLVFNKLGGAEQEVSVKRETDRNGEVLATAELDLSKLGLRDYELIAYHAEASDGNTLDGPGVGRSPVYFVEITNEEGAACRRPGQGQRVNLLVIQKQIIADTTALAATATADKFGDLTQRQRDAAEFARMYRDAIARDEAASAAAGEMESAIREMETAGGKLDQRDRASALPPEESALAHLYQVVKLLPELGALPTTPPATNAPTPASEKVQVVLEAIKQRKKQPPSDQDIEEALQQARDLARSQTGLNSALRQRSESGGDGAKQSAGATPSATAGASSSPSPGKASGQGQGQGQAQGEPGPNGSPEDAAGESPAAREAQSSEQLAQKETELSREAAALAERLQRLAGRDTRLGHNAGRTAGRAAASLAAAGQAAKQGGFGAAGEHGFQGELALQSLIAQLERILKNQPNPSDVASEDFPKEYEALISEYLKQLSHAD
jgi:hypothetical protein